MYPYISGTYLTPVEGVDAGSLSSSTARGDSNSFNWWDMETVPLQHVDYFGLPQEEQTEHGEFTKGILRGIDQMQGMLYAGAGLIGDAAGSDAMRDWGYENYQEQMEEASQYPKAVESYKDIDSVSSFLDYASGTLGELAPSMVGALASGGATALGTQVFGKKLLANAAANMITKRAAAIEAAQALAGGVVNKEVKDLAVAQATKQVNNLLLRRAAQTGAFGFTTAVESGGNWAGNVEEYGMENTKPMQDLLFGAASAAVEVIGGIEGSILKAVTGKAVSEATEKSFRRILMEGITKGMLQEGGEEALQETLSKINSNIQGMKGLITKEDINDIFEAAIAGALGGGVLGTGVLVSNRRNRTNLDNDTKELDDLAQRALDQKNAEEQARKEELNTVDLTNAENISANRDRRVSKYNNQTEFNNLQQFKANHDASMEVDRQDFYSKVHNGKTYAEWLSLDQNNIPKSSKDLKSIETVKKKEEEFKRKQAEQELIFANQYNKRSRVGYVDAEQEIQEWQKQTDQVTSFKKAKQRLDVQHKKRLTLFDGQTRNGKTFATWAKLHTSGGKGLTQEEKEFAKQVAEQRQKILSELQKEQSNLLSQYSSAAQSNSMLQQELDAITNPLEDRVPSPMIVPKNEQAFLDEQEQRSRAQQEADLKESEVQAIKQAAVEQGRRNARTNWRQRVRDERIAQHNAEWQQRIDAARQQNDPTVLQNVLKEKQLADLRLERELSELTRVGDIREEQEARPDIAPRARLDYQNQQQQLADQNAPKTEEWQREHPLEVAREKAEIQQSLWAQEAERRTAELEAQWQEEYSELVELYKYWREVLANTRMENLTPQQNKQVASVFAAHAKAQQELNEKKKSLQKELAKGFTAANGKLVTASAVAADQQYQKAQIDAGINQGLFNSVSEILSDVITYATRLTQVFDNRIFTIDNAINSLEARIEELSSTNSLTMNEFNRMNKAIKDLTNKRAEVIRAKRKVSRLMGSLSRRTKTLSSQNMKDIFTDIQDIYHTGNSILSLEQANDIARLDQNLSYGSMKDRFERLKGDLRRLQGQINNLNDNGWGDFKIEANEYLDNTKIVLDSTNFERDYPLATAPEATVDLQEDLAARERLDAKETLNRSVLSRAEGINQLVTEQQRNEAFAQYNKSLLDAEIQRLTGQQNTTLPDSEITHQEVAGGTISENPTLTSGQAESAFAAAQQAAREKEQFESLATAVLSNPESELLRKILTFLSNVLNNLPVLRDNTVICVDGNDAALPLEVKNALATVNNAPKGVYWNGKVYIFASNITNKQDAIRTLIHEGVAHFGLRTIFNDQQLGQFLSLVHHNFAGTREWNNFMSKYPNNAPHDRITMAEEFVAHIAEKMKLNRMLDQETSSIFTRIVSFLRNVLSRLGFGTKLTIGDIKDVLNLSALNLKNKNESIQNQLNEVVVTDADGINAIPVVNDTVYGIAFDNTADALTYYKQLERSRSGIPNIPYIYNYPKNNNTLNLNDSLNSQPESTKERLKKLLKEFNLSPTLEPISGTNRLRIRFLDKTLGEFRDPQFAESLLSRPEYYLGNVTGWDLYRHLVSNTDSNNRQVSKLFRDYGIRGAQFAHEGKNKYYLFEGNDLSTDPFVFDLSKLSEPKFLVGNATTDQQMFDPVTGLQVPKYTTDNTTYVNALFASAEKPAAWAKILNQFKTTGTVRDENGNIIDMGWTDRFIQNATDQYRRLKMVQDYLKNTYKNVINSSTNIYKNLHTITGEIRSAQNEALKTYWNPIMDAMKAIKADITFIDDNGNVVITHKKGSKEYENAVMAAIDLYAMARHAKERNASVSSRFKGKSWTDPKTGLIHRYNTKNPKTPSDVWAASGMTNDRAQQILDHYANVPGFQEVVTLLDKMNRFSLDTMLAGKLITEDSYKAMAQYNYYVPLQGWADAVDIINPGTYQQRGKTLSTGNKDVAKFAKGRTGLPVSPLLRSVQQMEDIIAIMHRNNLMRNFGTLVEATSNEKDLWEIDRKNPDAFRIQKMPDGSLVFRSKPSEYSGSGIPAVTYIDENGKTVRIVIKDKWLAAAMTGNNLAVQHPILDAFRKYTGLFAKLYTSYSPNFIITNPIRDFQSAVLNLGSVVEENTRRGLMENARAIQTGVVKDVTSAKHFKLLKEVAKEVAGFGKADLSKFNAQDVQDLNDWNTYGGHTKMSDVYTIEDRYKQLRNHMRETNGVKKYAEEAKRYLGMLSDVTENLTRFSVYQRVQRAFEQDINKKAKDQGWSASRIAEEMEAAKKKSANIALDCTVNFTRKGAWANAYNPLYAFMGASLQSFARIARNLWRPTSSTAENFARVGRYLAYGTAAPILHGMVCRALMGDDDDGINKYDKIPTYVKLGNLIIPSPFGDGGYIKIPLPYGYNTFWSVGISIDNLIHDISKPATAALDVIKTAVSGVVPIDPTNGFTALLPTLLKPIGELAENRNFAGVPIVPEGRGVEHLPDYLKSWTKTPQIWKDCAGLINYITGGVVTKDGIGLLDISPETLEHLSNSYMGGLGRITAQTMELITSAAFGYDVPAKAVPLLNRLYGTTDYDNTNAIYHEYSNQVEAAKAMRDLAKSSNPSGLNDIKDKYRSVLALERAQSKASKELNAIRKAENELRRRYPSQNRSSAYVNQMKLLEKRKERVMKQFNKTAHRSGLEMN